MSGGEWHAPFIPTFFDPAYSYYLDRLLETEGNQLASTAVIDFETACLNPTNSRDNQTHRQRSLSTAPEDVTGVV